MGYKINQFYDNISILYTIMMIEERYDKRLRRPVRERGFRAWFRRWFLCGYIEERRVMKIYMEVYQMDKLYENEI